MKPSAQNIFVPAEHRPGQGPGLKQTIFRSGAVTASLSSPRAARDLRVTLGAMRKNSLLAALRAVDLLRSTKGGFICFDGIAR